VAVPPRRGASRQKRTAWLSWRATPL